MGKRKYYMVLDTETVATARVPFDIAYTMIDRKGNIVEQRNYFVDEVLNSELVMYILSKDSFSKSKFDFYNQIKIEQPNNIMSFTNIAFEIADVLEKTNCAVVAYNAAFDVRALNNFSNAMNLGDFFYSNVEIWDLLNIALHSLCNSQNYVEFALLNNFITEAGNIKTSAEAVFNYLLKGEKFVEEHTALADSEIEARILQACFDRKKKLEKEYAGPIFNHPIWKEKMKLS